MRPAFAETLVGRVVGVTDGDTLSDHLFDSLRPGCRQSVKQMAAALNAPELDSRLQLASKAATLRMDSEDFAGRCNER